MKRIAIIGGGACGVAAFIELSQKIYINQLEEEVSIKWFEKSERLGFGVAFGTDQDGHLLNTQADLMGVYALEEGDFVRWLRENGGKKRKDVLGKGDLDDTYTPRKLYGHYLAERAEEYLQLAKRKGLKVTVVHSEVVRMRNKEKHYTLVDSEKQKHKVDYAILALGNPKPDKFEEFIGNKAYVDFPWPSKRLLESAADADEIGVVGTSLSAIDTVMTLVDNGIKGRINLFSPTGLLPKVQPVDTERYVFEALTLNNLRFRQRLHLEKPSAKDLFDLFRIDVKNGFGVLDWEQEDRIGQSARRLLREDIQKAESGGDPLLNFAYSLRREATPIWKMLSAKEKQEFKKVYGEYWSINRNGMPLPNAYKLRKLMNSDRLRVYANIENVRFSKAEKQFEIAAGTDRKAHV